MTQGIAHNISILQWEWIYSICQQSVYTDRLIYNICKLVLNHYFHQHNIYFKNVEAEQWCIQNVTSVILNVMSNFTFKPRLYWNNVSFPETTIAQVPQNLRRKQTIKNNKVLW